MICQEAGTNQHQPIRLQIASKDFTGLSAFHRQPYKPAPANPISFTCKMLFSVIPPRAISGKAGPGVALAFLKKALS
jgi:hypothetical protein